MINLKVLVNSTFSTKIFWKPTSAQDKYILMTLFWSRAMEISTEEGLKTQYKPDQVFSGHQVASGKGSFPQAESQV